MFDEFVVERVEVAFQDGLEKYEATVGGIETDEVAAQTAFPPEDMSTWPAVPRGPKRVVVETATEGAAVAPVLLASTELAAMVERLTVALLPPTNAPAEAETETPLAPERVVVETAPTTGGVPDVEVKYGSCPAVSLVEVARDEF